MACEAHALLLLLAAGCWPTLFWLTSSAPRMASASAVADWLRSYGVACCACRFTPWRQATAALLLLLRTVALLLLQSHRWRQRSLAWQQPRVCVVLLSTD